MPKIDATVNAVPESRVNLLKTQSAVAEADSLTDPVLV